MPETSFGRQAPPPVLSLYRTSCPAPQTTPHSSCTLYKSGVACRCICVNLHTLLQLCHKCECLWLAASLSSDEPYTSNLVLSMNLSIFVQSQTMLINVCFNVDDTPSLPMLSLVPHHSFLSKTSFRLSNLTYVLLLAVSVCLSVCQSVSQPVGLSQREIRVRSMGVYLTSVTGRFDAG